MVEQAGRDIGPEPTRGGDLEEETSPAGEREAEEDVLRAPQSELPRRARERVAEGEAEQASPGRPAE